MAKQQHQHRGRIQAQGGGTEKSEAWAQDEPLTIDKGLKKLIKLEQALSGAERMLRVGALVKAKKFMIKASENGGIENTKNTFLGIGNTRIDIEVIKGQAFVPESKEDDND